MKQRRMYEPQTNVTYNSLSGGEYFLYFDLQASYTKSFITRLLGISKQIASRYVDEQGHLTERGVQMFKDLNEELESTCGRKKQGRF